MLTWRSVSLGTPYRLPSVFDLQSEFSKRIESACSPEQLSTIAADIASVRQDYERRGIVRAPIHGDEQVKQAIRDSIMDQMGAVRSILFETAWDTADKGLDEGIRAGVTSALWETFDQIIESILGDFSRKAGVAIRSGRPIDVLAAASSAARALARSFGDRDGIMRETVRIMRRNGLVIDARAEQALRRHCERALGRLGKSLQDIAKLLSSPLVIFLRIIFTPSQTVDDAGQAFHLFQGLERQLARRLLSLAHPPQQSAAFAPRLEVPADWRRPDGPTVRGR